MQRRQFTQSTTAMIGLLVLAAHQQARALSLGDLTEGDASQGIKVALERARWPRWPCWARRMDSWATQKFGFPCPDFSRMRPSCSR